MCLAPLIVFSAKASCTPLLAASEQNTVIRIKLFYALSGVLHSNLEVKLQSKCYSEGCKNVVEI